MLSSLTFSTQTLSSKERLSSAAMSIFISTAASPNPVVPSTTSFNVVSKTWTNISCFIVLELIFQSPRAELLCGVDSVHRRVLGVEVSELHVSFLTFFVADLSINVLNLKVLPSRLVHSECRPADHRRRRLQSNCDWNLFPEHKPRVAFCPWEGWSCCRRSYSQWFLLPSRQERWPADQRNRRVRKAWRKLQQSSLPSARQQIREFLQIFKHEKSPERHLVNMMTFAECGFYLKSIPRKIPTKNSSHFNRFLFI